ncbi:hypothetical protein [Aquimarina sp. 2201CG14-23]|nr:hypothetical protein [Aquimarina sp. 2201CG14-23]MDH7445430.1 hypothetical protein [Aquimarina sp. 2201CG14-23]
MIVFIKYCGVLSLLSFEELKKYSPPLVRRRVSVFLFFLERQK